MPHFHVLCPFPAPGGAPGHIFKELALPVRDATLAQAIYLSGLVPAPALCSGLGRCGRCRVRFLDAPPPPLPVEEIVLSHHALDEGWRLACHRRPQEGLRLALPPDILTAGRAAVPSPAPHSALAVDLGTTSLHWQSVGPGDSLSGQEVNPQMGAGSDVMSRLAYAATDEGMKRLAGLARAALLRLAGGPGSGVRELCVAANPAMTSILLGKDCSGLSRAPYRLDYKGGVTETLPDLPPIWIPPQLAPFVGGDATAGYASLALDPAREAPRFPFLLADMGTNGEYILALSPTEALAASVPLGPALEGINLSLGTEARPGAVTVFTLTPLGLEPQVLGETAPKGISGSGYLSLLRALLKAGLLDRDGHFVRPQAASAALAKRIGSPEAGSGGEARLRLPGRLFLLASDVEELLKVKAAFSLAVARLLAAANLAPFALTAVYLAGALGAHVPPDALEELGFLPPGLGTRIQAVGNSSLAGAALFLREKKSRDASLAWAENVRTLELALDPAFTNSYAEHMIFSWKA